MSIYIAHRRKKCL